MKTFFFISSPGEKKYAPFGLWPLKIEIWVTPSTGQFLKFVILNSGGGTIKATFSKFDGIGEKWLNHFLHILS